MVETLSVLQTPEKFDGQIEPSIHYNGYHAHVMGKIPSRRTRMTATMKMLSGKTDSFTLSPPGGGVVSVGGQIWDEDETRGCHLLAINFYCNARLSWCCSRFSDQLRNRVEQKNKTEKGEDKSTAGKWMII